MIRPDQFNLPIFAIGAGVIHAIGLAVLLPLLITLPGPGGDIDSQAVSVDVDLVPSTPPSPRVDREVDQTSALPASPPSGASAPKDASGTGSDGVPGAVANVGPETSPSSMPAPGQASVSPGEAPAANAAPATKPKAKAAKLIRAPAKKPVLAHVKPAKPLVRRPVKTASKGLAPFKGSWSALLGGPPPSPSIKTQR